MVVFLSRTHLKVVMLQNRTRPGAAAGIYFADRCIGVDEKKAVFPGDQHRREVATAFLHQQHLPLLHLLLHSSSSYVCL